MRPGDNTLTLSIRLGSSCHPGWGGTLPAFLASPAFDDAFLAKVLASISSQAAYLARHLTAWGNWRIAHLDALVFTALRFPFLPASRDLLDLGIRGLRNALAGQFLPDGVHIERTPSYANWMTNVLGNYYRLPREFPEADAHVDKDLIRRALDYQVQSGLSGLNDSRFIATDEGEAEALRQRRRALRRLGLRATRMPLSQVFPAAGQVFCRSSWETGMKGGRESLSDQRTGSQKSAFSTAWKRHRLLSLQKGGRESFSTEEGLPTPFSERAYLALDAGTWGGGHGHLSRLGLVYRHGGRCLVADPGILTYEMTDPFGPYGKSTPAHSTLNLNGWNQCEADARLLRAESPGDVALVQAKYEGSYWPGRFGWAFRDGRGKAAFGAHERVVFWVKGEYLLVLDSMVSEADAEVRNVWQLGPMDAWETDAAALAWWSKNPSAIPLSPSGRPTGYGRDEGQGRNPHPTLSLEGRGMSEGSINLFLRCLAAPEGTAMETFAGSREPLRGWVGAGGAGAAPAPLVEFRYAGGGGRAGRMSAVLLAPFRGSDRPNYVLRTRLTALDGRLHYLELGLPDGSTDCLAWTKDLDTAIDGEGVPLESDGPFVCLRLKPDGTPARAFLVEATCLTHAGRTIEFEGRATRNCTM